MSVWWERIIFITTFLSDPSSSHDADDCYYCDERFWLMVTGQSDRDSTAPVKITNILQHIHSVALLSLDTLRTFQYLTKLFISRHKGP